VVLHRDALQGLEDQRRVEVLCPGCALVLGRGQGAFLLLRQSSRAEKGALAVPPPATSPLISAFDHEVTNSF
jgi:hypothetical protein